MLKDEPLFGSRWTVVVGGFLLAFVGGLSYSWGVFVEPMQHRFGWSKSSSMLPLSVFMIVFAITMIPAGKLQEKFGTRRLITFGAFMFLLANCLSALLHHLPYSTWLVFSYGLIGGLACGITYSCVAPPIRRWFPDFPGLAVSLGVMGFGLASFIFAPLKAHYIIPNLGLDGTFLFIAGLTFVLTMIASRLVVFPNDEWYMHIYGAMHLPDKTGMVRSNLHPRQMIRKPLFWAIWASFLLAVSGSLMIIGILPSYGLEVVRLSGGKAALAVSMFALSNGLSRPLAGFLSDRIGILKVIAVAYVFQAIVFFLFPFIVHSYSALLPAAIVLGLGIGVSLSLYPVLTSECFGVEHLGVNYGIVFSAYGFGALAIQGGAYLRDVSGSYTIPLLLAGLFSLFSTGLILWIRRKFNMA